MIVHHIKPTVSSAFLLAFAAWLALSQIAVADNIDLTACQGQRKDWASIRQGDVATKAIRMRADQARRNTWALQLDEHLRIPFPEGRITTVAASEKNGRVQFLFFIAKESHWSLHLSWLENTPIGATLKHKTPENELLPEDEAGLLRQVIKHIGHNPPCLEMTGHAAALAFAEMGSAAVFFPTSGARTVFSGISSDMALEEETSPRNSSGEKHWYAIFYPYQKSPDILQVHWIFQKQAPSKLGDVPLTALYQASDFGNSPPWSAALAAAIRSRSISDLRVLAQRVGWKLTIMRPHATPPERSLERPLDTH